MEKSIKLTSKGKDFVGGFMLEDCGIVSLEALRGKALGGDEFKLPVSWNLLGKPHYIWILKDDEYEFVD